MISTRLRVGRLGQNTLLSTGGLVIRALIQAAYLILLSRWMQPHGYGLFAGSVAAATLISPLSGWGISYVYTQWVARDPSSSRSLWATALLQIALSGVMLVFVLMLASVTVLGTRMDLRSMLIVGLAELIALPVALTASRACMALDRGASSALIMILVPGFRLLVALVFLALGAAGKPANIATFHFAGSVLGMLVAIYLMTRFDGAPAWRTRMPIREATREGSGYAVGSLVGVSYPEVDKVLLLQIVGAVATGNYTVAFRAISVLVLPISALAGAALPRLFAAHGGVTWPKLFKSMTGAAVGYGFVAVIAAVLLAPLIPHIFGASYAVSSKYLLLLSPWPVFFALHQSFAAALTASGKQVARVVVEATGLVLILALNLLLLRSMGVNGAVLALLITEVFMMLGCWLLVWRRRVMT